MRKSKRVRKESPQEIVARANRARGETVNGRTIQRVSELERGRLGWTLDITERNMKVISKERYDSSEKRKEMRSDEARFLFEEQSGTPVGFASFRFTIDDGDPVLYVYELQVDQEHRRQGIGRQLIGELLVIGARTSMKRVVLTVDAANEPARQLYQGLGFSVDSTSPGANGDGAVASYEILSVSISDQQFGPAIDVHAPS